MELCDCACPPDAGDPTVEVTLIGEWYGLWGGYADVWGDGDFAYIGHFGGSTINIVDISDPANPIGIEYVLPPPNTSASAQDVKVADGLMFIGIESGVQSVEIVDVRDPMNPQHLVAIDIAGYGSIHNVFYDNGWLYMADSNTTRVGIVDLRTLDPDNPPASPITTTAWIIENVGTSRVHDITVVDGRLYASAWDSGLWIYDVSNVAHEIPTLLGSTFGDNTHSAWPTANGDYVVTAEERWGGGIQVYRITDNGGSLDLELTDCLAVPEPEDPHVSAHNPLIVGYRVYNSWYEHGLLVFDIDPITGALQSVATYDTGPYDIGVSVWGVYPFLGSDRVLLADQQLGLLIVSLGSSCPWDCDSGESIDGTVGIVDFLALLAQWGGPGTCDFDGGGVGITDFLELLANWGPCP